MMASINTRGGERITAAAVAGQLQLTMLKPSGELGCMSVTMSTEDAARLADLVTGMACLAEEQDYELAVLVAYAQAGLPAPEL